MNKFYDAPRVFYPDIGECQIHKKQSITHFCTNLECLKQLCGECIYQHNEMHYQSQTRSPVMPLKTVIIDCQQKLAQAIIQFENEIKRYYELFPINPEQQKKEGRKQIQEYKELVIAQINEYFRQIEESFDKKIDSRSDINQQTIKLFSGTIRKINEIKKELNILMDQLTNFNYQYQAIVKVCRLDLIELTEYYQRKMQKIEQYSNLSPIVIKFEARGLQNVHDEIIKLIQFDEDKQNFAKEVDQKETQRTNFYNKQNQISNEPLFNRTGGLQAFQIGQGDSNSLNQLNLRIEYQDFFEPNIKEKVLHFFYQDQNQDIFNYYDLSNQKSNQMEQIILKNTTEQNQISQFHKTLVTPNGSIFLIGGRLKNGQKSNQVLYLDLNRQQLQPFTQLKVGRSSHCICFARNSIYVAGGLDDQLKVIRQFERIDLINQRVSQQQDMIIGTANACMCSFNDKYLFMFGGITEDKKLSQQIERFDIDNNIWITIDPKLSEQQIASFYIPQSMSAIQINESDMLIFGGYNEKNDGLRLSFVLSQEQDQDEYIIRCVHWKPLLHGDGFSNSQSIIYQKQVYALQNITAQNSDQVLDKNRRILQFNGREWKVLN